MLQSGCQIHERQAELLNLYMGDWLSINLVVETWNSGVIICGVTARCTHCEEEEIHYVHALAIVNEAQIA